MSGYQWFLRYGLQVSFTLAVVIEAVQRLV